MPWSYPLPRDGERSVRATDRPPRAILPGHMRGSHSDSHSSFWCFSDDPGQRFVVGFLGENTLLTPQPSAGRRYGPSAGGSAVGAGSSLLSGSSSGKRPDASGGSEAAAAAWGGIDAKPEADDYLHNPDPKRDRKVSLQIGFPGARHTAGCGRTVLTRRRATGAARSSPTEA